MINQTIRPQLLFLLSILSGILFLQSIVYIAGFNVPIQDQTIDDELGPVPPDIFKLPDPCEDKARPIPNKNNEPPSFPQDEVSEEQPEKCKKFKTFENSTLGFKVEYPPEWSWKSFQSSTEPDLTFESKNTSHSALDIDVQFLKSSAGLPFSCHGPGSQPGCKYLYAEDVSRYAYFVLELPSQLRQVVDYKTLIENPASLVPYLNVSLTPFGINDAKIIRSSPISIPSTSGTVFSGIEVLIQHLDDDTIEKDVFVRDRTHGYHLSVWPNDDQDTEIQQIIGSFTLISSNSKRSEISILDNEIKIEVELPLDVKKDSLNIEMHEQKVLVTGSTYSNLPFQREIEIPEEVDTKGSPHVEYIQNGRPLSDYTSGKLVFTFNKNAQ